MDGTADKEDAGQEVMRGLLLEQDRIALEIPPGLDRQALKLIRKGRVQARGWKNEGYVRTMQVEIDLDFQSRDQDELLAGIAAGAISPEELVTAFLAYLRARMVKLRGIPEDTARLHLKEAEYRFNTARVGGCLSRRILAILRERPMV